MLDRVVNILGGPEYISVLDMALILNMRGF